MRNDVNPRNNGTGRRRFSRIRTSKERRATAATRRTQPSSLSKPPIEARLCVSEREPPAYLLYLGLLVDPVVCPARLTP